MNQEDVRYDDGTDGASGQPAEATSSEGVTRQMTEVDYLRGQNHMYREWIGRLNQQLQSVLGMPQRRLDSLLERMLNSEVAIPLLQCYDAALQEKSEEMDRLQQENVQLRTRLELCAGERAELNGAVRVAEDLASTVRGKTTEELQRLDSVNKEILSEAASLRRELARALDAENTARVEADRSAHQVFAIRADLEKQRVENAQLGEALTQARAKLQARERADSEVEATQETQRVQLDYLTRENAERVRELEELRARMVQALRSAGDTHAEYIRLLNERHSQSLEELRSANRAHEMEVLKLRAQLARADPSNPAGGSQRHTTLAATRSTTELMEAQVRQSQEMELKRLYGELATAQMQRDEALHRYEQLAGNLRREQDQTVQDAHREAQLTRKKLAEEQKRADRLEQEVGRLQGQLTELREKLSTAQQTSRQLQTERAGLSSQVCELQRKWQEAQEQLQHTRDEAATSTALERQRADGLEQRVTDALKELSVSKERAVAEVAAAEAMKAQYQREALEYQRKLQAAQTTLLAREREREVLQTQQERLNDALGLHKRQLAACDERLRGVQSQLEESRQHQRASVLAMERLKIDNARLLRAQEQLVDFGGGIKYAAIL